MQQYKIFDSTLDILLEEEDNKQCSTKLNYPKNPMNLLQNKN